MLVAFKRKKMSFGDLIKSFTHDQLTSKSPRGYGKSLVMSLELDRSLLLRPLCTSLTPLHNNEGSSPLWTAGSNRPSPDTLTGCYQVTCNLDHDNADGVNRGIYFRPITALLTPSS